MSNLDVVRLSAAALDLGPRVRRSGTVDASPAAAAETVICTVVVPGNLATSLGVVLFGQAAYTVGASGTAVQLRIRKDTVAGTALKATGALPRAAGILAADPIFAVDTAPTLPNQTYVLTMIVTAGAATSTVSAAELIALVV